MVDIKYLRYAGDNDFNDPNDPNNPNGQNAKNRRNAKNGGDKNSLSDQNDLSLRRKYSDDSDFEDEDDHMEYYHEDAFSDDLDDELELVKRNSVKMKKFNGRDSFNNNNWNGNGEFGPISEKPGEEDGESLSREMRRNKKGLVYGGTGKRVRDEERKYELGDEEERLSEENREKRKKDKKRKKNDKNKDKDKDKDKEKDKKSKKKKKKRGKEKEGRESLSKQKEKEVEKKFKIYEYDIEDNNMVFGFRDNPVTLKSVGLGHAVWLSAILYIREKDLLVTGGYDDFSVKMWRLDRKTLTTTKVGEYKNHRNHITKLMYDSTRDYLMVGSQDCSFSVISLANIKKVLDDEFEESVPPMEVEQR